MILLITKFLSFATAASHVFLLFGIIYFFAVRVKQKNTIIVFFARNGIFFAFLTALSATVASLFYSDFAGYVPCILCWYQRVFMYPQIILLGFALLKKKKDIIDYALALVFAGVLVALYHNYISYGGTSIFPCDANGFAISCAKRYIFELGYVTLPIMSLTSFLLVGTFLWLARFYEKNK